MALVKATFIDDLKASLKSIFEDLDANNTAEEKAEQIATAIADVVDAYVRSAVVTTTVIGTCPSGGGPLVGGAGTGALS